MFAVGGIVFMLGDVGADMWVAFKRCRCHRGGQHYPFKCFATAESHIYLAGSERGACVDYNLVESETLALVDCDCPGKTQRHLGECALHFGLDCVGCVVDSVFGIFPHLRSDFDGAVISRT